jgi:predicted XRE-type DNA-binding protein
MGQWVGYKQNKKGLLLIIETNQTKPNQTKPNQNHRVDEIFKNNRQKLVRMVKQLTTCKNLKKKGDTRLIHIKQPIKKNVGNDVMVHSNVGHICTMLKL